jgi:Na+/H+-dicarboxylate symporter
VTDRSALTKKILFGMFSGLLLGSLAHSIALDASNPIMQFGINGLIDLGGQIFIVTLKLLVVPLVFVSLACGASNLSGGTSLGRIGIKTLVLYLFTTAAAISLALIAANIINPGLGMSLASDTVFVAKESPPIKQVFLEIFPSNPVKAMAEGNMLQVIVFAILVGVAISKSGEHGSRLRDSLDDWNEVIMKLVLMLMSVAPIGVFCLMTTVFANMGFGGIFDLAKYFFNVVLVLVLHFALTYFLLLRFLAGLNPLRFYKDFYPVMVYAFSTSSSSATINMDGTAIMQGVATVFIAQAYSVEIGLAGYMTVILTATMASIGTAGVPGVGLITLALVLQQVGLPVEGIALIIGVDRLLDMLRTSVNVGGDATVASIVAKSEGKLDY